MTLYDEYRKDNPINPEPLEFRDIVEAEVKRALAWRGNLVGVEKWTEADYEFAKWLTAPIFDKIAEYESLHYPIAEPSKEGAESFRREQEKPLPAEEIKPGRYRMTATMDVEVRKGPCAPLMKIEQVFGIYYLTDFPGATFQAVEEG